MKTAIYDKFIFRFGKDFDDNDASVNFYLKQFMFQFAEMFDFPIKRAVLNSRYKSLEFIADREHYEECDFYFKDSLMYCSEKYFVFKLQGLYQYVGGMRDEVGDVTIRIRRYPHQVIATYDGFCVIQYY